ncbi:MAG: hypothetical protein ACI4WS_11530 [Oscillospiraceae bacterium]
MSYTRSYSSTITVTGSRNVSYPASEHGGSMNVSFSETVPVKVNITVATEPFDKSVSSASLHVDGLTASIAAMNAANCAAIAESSDKISDSISSGFFNLIQNDITTKKAETNTLIQTKSALLLEHSKAVEDKHTRMQTDVEREKAKYGKIIKDLDAELSRRINEIDKPAFKLSRKVREEVVVMPYLSIAAATADKLGPAGCSENNIAVAGLRQKVSSVIQNLTDFLHNNLNYRHMMRNILWSKTIDEGRQLSYIPVAYCISEDMEGGRNVCQCYVSDNANKNSILSSVTSYVSSRYALGSNEIPRDELKLIDQAFSSMVQDSYSSDIEHNEYQERVYTEICKLWKTGCQSLKQV